MNTSYNACIRAVTASLLVVVGTAITSASENGKNIAVMGHATVEAKPDTMEMTVPISAEAEAAGDAIEKFESNKRRAIEVLDNLGLAELTVEGTGISISSGLLDAQEAQMAARRGQVQPDVVSKLAVSEVLEIRLGSISEMDNETLLKTVSSIMDACEDAGLEVGPTSQDRYQMQMRGGISPMLATFRLSSIEAVENDAYEKAMKDAMAEGQRLARLAGVKLGDVISVRGELAANPEWRHPNRQYRSRGYSRSYNPGSRSEYRSESFDGIPVTATLHVQFEIN